jgi:hypothetical protein
MKKILICLMFSWMMNFATDNRNSKNTNTELTGSWQHKTNYYSGKNICYTEIENFYFYSDNSCVRTKITTSCDRPQSIESNAVTKWIIVKNNIVLLDKNGKQQCAYTTKSNIADLIKGENIMKQDKQLDAGKAIRISGDELAYTK